MNLNEAIKELKEHGYILEAKMSKANQAKYDAAIAALEELGYDTRYIEKKKVRTAAQQKQDAKDKAAAEKKWGKLVNTGKHWYSKYPKENPYEEDDAKKSWDSMSDAEKLKKCLPHLKNEATKKNPATGNFWQDDVLDIPWVYELYKKVTDKLENIGYKNDLTSAEIDDIQMSDIENGFLYDLVTIKKVNELVKQYRVNY